MGIKDAQLKVGLFSLAALFLLFFIIIWGKGFNYAKDKYKINIVFESSGGLLIGEPVAIRGVVIGRVNRISLGDNNVVVEVSINNSVKLYSDAKAHIENQEIMGGKKIELFAGSGSGVLTENATIYGENFGGLLEMAPYIISLAENMGSTLSKLDTTLIYFNQVLNSPERFDKLDKIIDNLSVSTNSLSSFLEKNEEDMSKILRNISSSTRDISEIFDGSGEQIKQSINRFVNFSKTLDSLSNSLSLVMNNIEDGKGTIGKLISDDEIYMLLRNTATELDSVSRSVKKNLSEFLKRTDIQLIKIF
jgi:phospholipid/cholesterol/gamma-HCH transport system substrate-binding protein